MTDPSSNAAWREYEKTAAFLLDRFRSEFGLKRVEGKGSLPGKITGTSWEIDAIGFREVSDAFVLIECRRYTTSHLSQEKIGALAFGLADTGASGGIVVTPLSLQEGAAKVASATNILSVRLDAESTPKDFALEFLGRLFVGRTVELAATMTVVTSVTPSSARPDYPPRTATVGDSDG